MEKKQPLKRVPYCRLFAYDHTKCRSYIGNFGCALCGVTWSSVIFSTQDQAACGHFAAAGVACMWKGMSEEEFNWAI